MNSSLPIELKNGYILIEDVKNEHVTESGLYIPDEDNNRFSRVVAVTEGSLLKPGDIIIKPIGRESKIKLNDKIYGCLRENLIFAKIVESD